MSVRSNREDRYQELLKEYKRIAKRADQRLVRLEKLSQEDQFETATKWAYARAMKDIHKWSGEDAARFNTKAPESITSLKAKIADIKQFIEKDNTSTKTGIVKEYKARVDRYNQQFGTDFTWESFAKFHQSGKFNKLDKKIGYATASKAIAVIQKNKKEIREQLENGDVMVQVKGQDSVINAAINKILAEYNYNIDDL